MLFNAVSGCDTVSSCLGHRKKSAWLAWRSCPSVIDAFFDLSLQPVDVSSETLEGIERFLVVMYSRTCSASGVRKELLRTWFSDNGTKQTNQSGIAATCATRGIARGYVWSQALVPVPIMPSPALWGGGGSHLIRGGNPFGLN